MPQRLLLPATTALRVVGTDTVEVAVDGENKLVLCRCTVALDAAPTGGGGQTMAYFHAVGGATYERIATGTVTDAAFYACGRRVALGALPT